MIIKCGDQIFDPNVTPCMIVLTDVDKDNIARMLPEADRYASFPDRMTEREVEAWMGDPRIPKAHAGPLSAITGGAPCCEKSAKLEALINTPELIDFPKAVHIEAVHQVNRWGPEHDANKTPEDWFWLLGYVAGKALAAIKAGNTDKGLHHIITSAAVLNNWHKQLCPPAAAKEAQ